MIEINKGLFLIYKYEKIKINKNNLNLVQSYEKKY